MTTYNQSAVFRAPTIGRRLAAVVDEVVTFLDALTSPRKIIAEVEEMRALQLEAGRVEAVDPKLASVLRQRASLMCLR